MKALTITSLIISLFGILNWLIIGIFNWSFVAAVFGAGTGTRVIYIVFALAGAWLLGHVVRMMTRTKTVSGTRI